MTIVAETKPPAGAPVGTQRRSDVEARLSAVTGVDECVVLRRLRKGAAESGGEILVAYVVPAAGYELSKLRRQVSAAALGPAAFVPVMVRRIPRLADGAVDVAALLAIPAITADSVREQLSPGGPGHEGRLTFELRRVEPRVPVRLGHDHDNALAVASHGRDAGGTAPGRAASPAPGTRRAPAAADLPRALIGGAALIRRPEDPETLTDAILAAAGREFSMRVISADRNEAATSAELLQRARRILGGLRQRGLSPGSAALLQISALEDHFPVLWACLLGGIRSLTVAAPPAGYGQRSRVLDKLINAWEDIGSPLIITDAATASAMSGAGDLYGAGALPVASVADLSGAAESDHILRPAPSDVALLQLTSGSTGRPKVIQITHRAVVEMALAARAANEVCSGDITYNWLPMDHVVPTLMFHLRGTILGCNAIHSPTSYVLADPLRWLDVLHEYRVSHSWSPNFGFKLVTDALRSAEGRNWDLSSVKTLVNAGEQCTGPVMRQFRARTEAFGLRPEAMRLSWGMAETATCIVYKTEAEAGSSRRVLKSSLGGLLEMADDVQPAGQVTEFLSMGVVDPGARLRIVDAESKTLPERMIGRLQASSARVTPGYLNNPKANTESFTADGWFDTGDLAFVVDGELVITGRAKEQIVINGVNYYCYEIEDACGVVEGVRNGMVAAVGIPDERTGTEALGIFFVPEEQSVLTEPGESAEVTSRIRLAMAAGGQFQPQYVVPLAEGDFPRTTSGKLQRGQLVEKFLAGGFTDVLEGLAGATPVPDCVFRPGWQMLELTAAGGASPAGVTLAFADEQGVADRLAVPGRVIMVRPGAGFAATDEGFRLDPSSARDWVRLAEALDEQETRPDMLLYLWSYLSTPSPDGPARRLRDAEVRCGEYLLACHRALVAPQERRPQVVTVSQGLHRVTGGEALCFPAALAASISSVATAELPDVATWHVDLPGDTAEADAGALAAVLQARRALPREVAWRDGHVYVPCLDPMAEVEQPRDALTRGGWYVVAGGDGGIGRHLLPELADRYGVRFLVLSRRAVGENPAIRFQAADIADMEAVRHAVARVRADWGTAPSGVLHLADIYRFRLLTEETGQTWRDALRAKTQGTVNLAALARECGGHLVIFASLLGWLGSAGCGAYVAGSRYAEALSEYLRARAGLDVWCLAWGLWQATGLNRDNPYEDMVRRRGVLSLAPDVAATLNRLVLRQLPGNYLVGINGAAEQMCGLVRSARQLPLEYPVIVAPEGVAPPGTLLPVQDAFGVPSHVTVVAEAAVGSRQAESEAAALAEVVEAVLRTVVTGELSRKRPFHELGLSSIQVLQIHTRLEKRLGRSLPQVAFYEHPTIDALAAHLAGGRQ
jgi:acyl-CoA synthetase (AMP-forming)/AMP-acid ligase II/acyl carrier protein